MAAVAAPVTIFNVIGVFSAVIGLMGFILGNVPKNKVHPEDSSVRVAIALNGNSSGLKHAGGAAPFIQTFNENGGYIGENGYEYTFGFGSYIESGSYHDAVIKQRPYGPGQQATYLQIIPGDNELCIAYIAQTWSDGTHRGWLGDMGKGCDKDWLVIRTPYGVKAIASLSQ